MQIIKTQNDFTTILYSTDIKSPVNVHNYKISEIFLVCRQNLNQRKMENVKKSKPYLQNGRKSNAAVARQ